MSDNLEKGTYNFTPNEGPAVPNTGFVGAPPAPFKVGGYVNEEKNAAVQIIEFAREQMAKLTADYKEAASTEYNEAVVHGTIEVMKNLVEAAVRIEALNTLKSLNITDYDVVRDIFNDSIFG